MTIAAMAADPAAVGPKSTKPAAGDGWKQRITIPTILAGSQSSINFSFLDRFISNLCHQDRSSIQFAIVPWFRGRRRGVWACFEAPETSRHQLCRQSCHRHRMLLRSVKN